MEEKFAILRIGQGYHHNGTHGYNTLEQALADGAVVLAYGYVHFSTLLSSNPLTMVIDTGEYVYKGNTDARRTFLNKVFNFMGVGMALYTVASVYEWCSNDSIIKCTVKCKYCKKRISEKVCRSYHAWNVLR
jgi:large conductance mechanosensitive channel